MNASIKCATYQCRTGRVRGGLVSRRSGQSDGLPQLAYLTRTRTAFVLTWARDGPGCGLAAPGYCAVPREVHPVDLIPHGLLGVAADGVRAQPTGKNARCWCDEGVGASPHMPILTIYAGKKKNWRGVSLFTRKKKSQQLTRSRQRRVGSVPPAPPQRRDS